ncbi:MAG: AAA family ATPase [Synechococcus sp. SB0677_bin_5]|nr:AAA family ATPase [Synechococcus sp. SB0677_bin_5]
MGDQADVIERFSVKTFKSLEEVTIELGQVNVFVGASGSGKSNLLEALGVLSAAANGKVDEQALLARGVRPGVPKLYKSAFPAKPETKIPAHLRFEAYSSQAEYGVSLLNSLKDPKPIWTFKNESWKENDSQLVGHSPATRPGRKEATNEKPAWNKERGLAALKAVEVSEGPALSLLESLQSYVIFFPATAVLRALCQKHSPKRRWAYQEVIFCQRFTVWLYSAIRMRKSGRFAKIFWISLIGPRRLN